MTTTTILMLCLVAFLVIIFYKIFGSVLKSMLRKKGGNEAQFS